VTFAPVFVVGMARSGTTLLYRSLLQHPAFDRGPVDFTESFAVSGLTIDKTMDAVGWRLPHYMGGGDDGWARFLRETRLVRAWRRAWWPLLGHKVQNGAVWRFLGSVSILRRYFAHAAASRAPARVAEKTAANLAFVPHLRTAFPDAKMLVIVRHPVDVLASYWRRHRAEPDAAWAAITVEDFCALWSASIDLVTTFSSRWPDSILVVRYEDFTNDPRRTFATVCEFIGEPLFEAALVGHRDRVTDIDPLAFEDIQPGGSGGPDLVGPEVAGDVQDHLARAMAALNYERR
jgi:hypothetical protein